MRAAEGHLGLTQAGRHAREAAEASRGLGDPAVLLQCLTVWFELEASEAVLAEAQATARHMLAAVSHAPLRRRFLASLRPILAVRV